MKIKKTWLILLILLAIGAFLRFYNYENRISLGWESARDYFVSDVGWGEKQLPLTGPWASIAPLTIGPWYWYFLILSRFFIPSLYAPWIALGLASLSIVLIMYRIGVLLIDKRLGLILAFLAALSPNLLHNSLFLTNPSLIVFLSSLCILVFLEIFIKNRGWLWGVLLGWLVGFTLLTHYQGGGLLTLVLLLLFLRKKKVVIFLSSLLGLFIAALPMLIFELNNHWFNTRGVLDFVLYRQYQLWTSMRWLKFIFELFPDTWVGLTGGPPWFGLVLMFGSGLILFLRLIRKKLPFPLFLLGISFLIQVIVVRYWRGERYLGWIQFFSPYLFIFTGLMIYDLLIQRVKKQHFYLAFGLIFFLWAGLISNSLKARVEEEDVNTKKIREEIGQLGEIVGEEKFSFYYCGDSDGNEYNRNSYLLMLFLEKAHADDGYKIGLANDYCQLPFIDKKKEELHLIGALLDFSQASEAGILKNNWKQETAQPVYDRYAKWWYEEKP